MTLLVTVFLVLVNIFNTITTNIPKASANYLKLGIYRVVLVRWDFDGNPHSVSLRPRA